MCRVATSQPVASPRIFDWLLWLEACLSASEKAQLCVDPRQATMNKLQEHNQSMGALQRLT
jgi:hypothetical protein